MYHSGVRNADKGWGYAYVGAEGIWEIPILSSQFCYEHKTAVKKLTLQKWVTIIKLG